MIKIVLFLCFTFFIVGCEKASTATVTTENESTNVPVEGDVSSPSATECFNTTIEAASSTPMLTILISYNNQTISSDELTWAQKLYGKELHQLNSYYLQASNTKFEFAQARESAGCENDGVISVKLNKNHPNSSYLSSVYPDLEAALVSADEKINFSNFDADANGHITPDELVITFIIAGYEDAYEGYHVYNGIWAHMSCMESSNTPLLDGVTLMGCNDGGTFALFGELHDRYYVTHDATVGIIAHELGHSAFALPDLYNTQGATGGIGIFGLMGGGSWAQSSLSEYPGDTPTHFSAWSKIHNGWITPQLAQAGTTHTLSETTSDTYNIIKIPISSTEYYLLENRNNSGYDKGFFALEGNFNGGMALWRINEAKLSTYYLSSNEVNADTSNKGVDLVEAANNVIDTQQSNGNEANLFYAPNVSSYSYQSDISDISQRGSVMTLTIN